MKTAIILDAEQRVALAVARNLGQHGVRVIACSSHTRPLAGASRWVDATHHLPDLQDGIRPMIDALQTLSIRERAAIVMPLTDASLTALAEARSIGPARVAAPPPAAYAAVSDKVALWQRAAKRGVPVPRSVVVSSPDEFRSAMDTWTGPVVIKPALSRYVRNDRVESTAVRIASSPNDAISCLDELDWLDAMPCLLQEFVPGSGAGVFTVYGSTGALTWFAHRRVREKPPGGGVSVVSESVPVDTTLRDHAATLLGAVDWRGPAMVEFRVDPDGNASLMEINGRFWGSLQLAIDAGLDLPWHWFRTVIDDPPVAVEAYETGRRLRWLLGDADSLYLTLRDAEVGWRSKASAIAGFFNFFTRGTRLEVLRLGDPHPFLRELRQWLAAVFRRNTR